MSRRRMIELYSGASGAGTGYERAGFELVCVDINPQPHCPHPFIQADALEVLADRAFLADFDAIHASPTCQYYAAVTQWRGSQDDHPDLLTPTLELLDLVEQPWIVENVPRAVTHGPLRADYMLCGTQFDLRVRRHRAFQLGNWSSYELLPRCTCYRHPGLVPFEHKDERAFADAMGCTWMNNLEARQAIPPVYTEFLGRQLMTELERRTVA